MRGEGGREALVGMGCAQSSWGGGGGGGGGWFYVSGMKQQPRPPFKCLNEVLGFIVVL